MHTSMIRCCSGPGCDALMETRKEKAMPTNVMAEDIKVALCLAKEKHAKKLTWNNASDPSIITLLTAQRIGITFDEHDKYTDNHGHVYGLTRINPTLFKSMTTC